jgi:PEP-CTERM/exosortase A-associated glycosyltransferase
LHSGYSFRTRAILEQQQAMGWKTEQITGSKHYGSSAGEEWVDGFHFYRTLLDGNVLERLPVFNQYEVVRKLERRLHEILSAVQPDILHAHSPCLNGLAAVRVGKACSLPVVYELRASWEDAAVDHGTTREGSLRYHLSRALETWVLERADAVTTICAGLRHEILSRGIAADKVTVIPNAVDAERFVQGDGRRADLAGNLGLKGGPVLGFIGSFYAYEGLGLLLQALPAIREVFPEVRLMLVGGGPQEGYLRQLVAESGLEDTVRFIGRISHDSVQAYYDLVDIFIYPRLSMRLTEMVTPLKPLEAMARRRLVVASDVGGHRELIRNGETGVLFPAGNVVALTETVVDLLLHPERWEGLRAEAGRFIKQERTWQSCVKAYVPVYERLVGGNA